MLASKSRAARRALLSKKLRGIADELVTLSFEGNVWSRTLPALQNAFGTALACKYLPEKRAEGWSFDSMEVAAAPHISRETFRSNVLSTLGRHFCRYTFFDPLTPDPRQRDRALLLPDIPRITGRSANVMNEYRANLGIDGWDQLRILVCDGPHLSSWVGMFSERKFDEVERDAFQQLLPSLKSRLRFEQLSRHAAQASATLEATLEAVPVPCFILDASGRVLEANQAARSLYERDHELRALSAVVSGADPRFDVQPVRVCGVTASYLASLRAPFSTRPQEHALRAERWRLTKRQTTVLACIVQGLANKEIAARLNIALGTVELHVTAILAKARVDSRSLLVAAYWSTS
jgi:DNA-binding CsgD family transcriptional regulator